MAGQGEPLRISPSHQLPISPTTRASGADRRRRSIVWCENWPGNACAATITSGEKLPSDNAAAAESASEHSTTVPHLPKQARVSRNSGRVVSPRTRIESDVEGGGRRLIGASVGFRAAPLGTEVPSPRPVLDFPPFTVFPPSRRSTGAPLKRRPLGAMRQGSRGR